MMKITINKSKKKNMVNAIISIFNSILVMISSCLFFMCVDFARWCSICTGSVKRARTIKFMDATQMTCLFLNYDKKLMEKNLNFVCGFKRIINMSCLLVCCFFVFATVVIIRALDKKEARNAAVYVLHQPTTANLNALAISIIAFVFEFRGMNLLAIFIWIADFYLTKMAIYRHVFFRWNICSIHTDTHACTQQQHSYKGKQRDQENKSECDFTVLGRRSCW